MNINIMQNTGLKRKLIDKFYTSPDIVNQCINFIEDNIKIEKDDLCIEPSAGDGAFIPGIKSLCNNAKFYDISPDNIEIQQQNYLEYDYSALIKKPDSRIHIIGNPPFGRQSSMAIKFIKKSCEFCYSISFILPKSFKKESLQKYFPLKYHLLCAHFLWKYCLNKLIFFHHKQLMMF